MFSVAIYRLISEGLSMKKMIAFNFYKMVSYAPIYMLLNSVLFLILSPEIFALKPNTINWQNSVGLG